jgi:hypothetical protein
MRSVIIEKWKGDEIRNETGGGDEKESPFHYV